jgi:NAD(P)-dependent dehydrogenase (short-subunit alcohol dehydrogenase family)
MGDRLRDSVCLVTGAGSGIGRATALLFASEGARVAVNDIRGDRVKDTVAAIAGAGGHALGVEADVSRADQVGRMFDETLRAWSRLDVLVNNAGFGIAATVEHTEEAEWDRLMAVNLKGVFLCSKRAIPIMRRQGGGVIVNTASVTATVGIRNRAAYVASKGGVASLTRALALDHVGDGIRVNCVAPGTIDTPFFDDILARHPDPAAYKRELASRQVVGRLGRPEEVAQAILYLASPASSFVTGSMLTVDGGMTAW